MTTQLEGLILARIAELMDAQPNTDEATELLLLVKLQEFYERNLFKETAMSLGDRREAEDRSQALTVAQLISELSKLPGDLAVRIYRGGAYGDALWVEPSLSEKAVYICDRLETS